MPSHHSIRIFARLTLGLVLIAACASPSGPRLASDAPAERLDGSWRWVSSVDVRTAQVSTPATAGFEAILTFRIDSARSGAYVYTKTGHDPIAGRFSIAYEDAPGNDFLVLDKGIDFLTRNAWLAAGTDSLRLGGVMELGFNSVYARITP